MRELKDILENVLWVSEWYIATDIRRILNDKVLRIELDVVNQMTIMDTSNGNILYCTTSIDSIKEEIDKVTITTINGFTYTFYNIMMLCNVSDVYKLIHERNKTDFGKLEDSLGDLLPKD